MGVIERFFNDLLNPPAAPSGPLVARPAEGRDLSRYEGGILNIFFQRSTDYKSARQVKDMFDAFLPYMLVVEKNDKIVGLGVMRRDGALKQGENCVTMLMTDPGENGYEILKTLIGGFARQALSYEQKNLNILAMPDDKLTRQVCDAFKGSRTDMPVGGQMMAKYSLDNLRENFVKDWEDDQDDDFINPPDGPKP